MNVRKKFYIIFFGFFALSFALFYFGKKLMNNAISNFTSGKTDGVESLMGVSNVPVFKSGTFSDDGNYFAYTYQPEVEKPDVDGSITMRGFAYPTYFQVMETATGKPLLKKAFESGKYDQMYVVWEQDGLVWLMQSVYHKGNRLALYDVKSNQFRYEFGELEKLNPSIDWKSTNSFFINSSAQKGLILEANDKRYYRIDPNSGKAETVQGKLEMVNYNFVKNFQVSDRNSDRQYSKKEINGSRKSITTNNGKTVSQDDFIEVKYLTLTKSELSLGRDAPITYYKNNFFVLSPINSDNEKDMELAMLDKTTLKTVWKIQLPQKELKTFIPNYELERFFIKGDQMLVTNNDYLLTINLENGKIVKQEGLYE